LSLPHWKRKKKKFQFGGTLREILRIEESSRFLVAAWGGKGEKSLLENGREEGQRERVTVRHLPEEFKRSGRTARFKEEGKGGSHRRWDRWLQQAVKGREHPQRKVP